MQAYPESLSLRYEITLEDRLGFSLYHTQHSPAIRSALWRYRLAPPILWFIIGFLLVLLSGWTTSNITTLIFLCLVSLVWLPLAPKIWLMRVRKQMQCMLREGQVKSRETVTLRLTSEGLRVEGEDSEGFYKWSAVQKVAISDSHIYLYVTSMNAVPVPRSAFADERAYAHFLQTVRQYREQSAGLPAAGMQ